ncbi:hypothetical protein AVEN_222751-1 [Araneus ventricosus]|uniref:Uncharacterized protein n=1 Tax=Araneus ventricosus TaxID=182803 RepID=A0A4Y2B1X8_ARAVE|nr:hypothetical protein AVEN_222751-1 [Araneus ventricosus]
MLRILDVDVCSGLVESLKLPVVTRGVGTLSIYENPGGHGLRIFQNTYDIETTWQLYSCGNSFWTINDTDGHGDRWHLTDLAGKSSNSCHGCPVCLNPTSILTSGSGLP